MRIFFSLLSIVVLGACMSPEPDSNQGVGFGNYELYRKQQAYMGRAPGGTPASQQNNSMAMNQAQYPGVSAGTDVPDRSGPAKSNIAEFALSTSHPVGTQMYRRSALGNKSGRACARYASDSLAQEAFLDAGGPQRDRHGLDPDGDGYACNWDPAAFRLARG